MNYRNLPLPVPLNPEDVWQGVVTLLVGVLIALSLLVGGSDIDGAECFEDEYVVLVISSWPTTPDQPNGHNVPEGWLACVPIDNTRGIDIN